MFGRLLNPFPPTPIATPAPPHDVHREWGIPMADWAGSGEGRGADDPEHTTWATDRYQSSAHAMADLMADLAEGKNPYENDPDRQAWATDTYWTSAHIAADRLADFHEAKHRSQNNPDHHTWAINPYQTSDHAADRRADLAEGKNTFENDANDQGWAADTDPLMPSEEASRSESGPEESGDDTPAVEADVPAKVEDVLKYIDEHNGNPRPDYKGNGQFDNDGRSGSEVLPKTDADGNAIVYREYDVNPYEKGVNRGGERLVIGTDGTVRYTSDHYVTFTRIR
jgi:guanyl-specific ribonuclease Sa